MKSTESAPALSFNTIKQRRELLETKTELQHTRRKLVRTESALESLAGFLTTLPDPIEIVSADLFVLFANEASKNIHNNPQLEGSAYYGGVIDAEPAAAECPIRSALDGNQETKFSAVFQSGGVYEIKVTPTRLSDGRRAAICSSRPAGSGRPDPQSPRYDIDESKLLKRIATLSTRTLDAILDLISDGVVVANNRGDAVLSNHAFCGITGFSPDNPASLPDILFPVRPEAEATKELTTPAGIRRFETSIRGSDGGLVPVAMTIAGIPEDQDNPAGVLVTVRDLRETHEIKDQLIRSLNLSVAGERIATLAHQVNNYLTPAFHHADTLSKRDNLDTRTRQSVNVIQNYLNLCHESILMVLSLIRPAVPTVVNLNSLIAEVFSKHYLADELALDNVEIEQEFDPLMVETMGYRVLLQQALVNIIKNSLEAMADQDGPRRVRIVTESTPATITVKISDNGPGVARAIQNKVFELMVSSKPVGKGHGIGLRFAKEVVDKHGGTIDVDSQPGQGATFAIRLPVRAPEDADLGRAVAPPAAPVTSLATTRPLKGRILIIDDDPGILEILSDILEERRHAVTTTADAYDALEKINAENYHCLICDIKMPEMDGREFSRRIKAESPELYERLVFITGDIFSDETDTFIQDTGSPCIEKPFTSEQVHDVVQKVLARSVEKPKNNTDQQA